MTAPPSVLILSLMANLCFRWFSERTAVFFCIECHLLLNALGHGLLHLSGLQKTVSATAFPRLDHRLQEVISISILKLTRAYLSYFFSVFTLVGEKKSFDAV